MEPSTQQTSPTIPIAIIIGFAMVALAIYFTSSKSETTTVNDPEQASAESETAVRPVDATDYIKGNPNAPILMVEYSDYDCPFCKQFHVTMNQVLDEYGINGKIAWVYRQFPLAQLHPNSPLISEAALCVGNLGGNKAFWTFSDLIFENREIDAPTNVTKLVDYAESSGVSVADYTKCINGDSMEPVLEASIKDGFNSGARGTPYTVLMVGDQQAVINGAQPYSVVKGIVANLISQLEGSFVPPTTNPSDAAESPRAVPAQ